VRLATKFGAEIVNVRNTVCSSSFPSVVMGNFEVIPLTGKLLYPTTRFTLHLPDCRHRVAPTPVSVCQYNAGSVFYSLFKCAGIVFVRFADIWRITCVLFGIPVFWGVTLHRWLSDILCWGGKCRFHILHGPCNIEYEGDTSLRNFGICLPRKALSHLTTP